MKKIIVFILIISISLLIPIIIGFLKVDLYYYDKSKTSATLSDISNDDDLFPFTATNSINNNTLTDITASELKSIISNVKYKALPLHKSFIYFFSGFIASNYIAEIYVGDNASLIFVYALNNKIYLLASPVETELSNYITVYESINLMNYDKIKSFSVAKDKSLKEYYSCEQYLYNDYFLCENWVGDYLSVFFLSFFLLSIFYFVICKLTKSLGST